MEGREKKEKNDINKAHLFWHFLTFFHLIFSASRNIIAAI